MSARYWTTRNCSTNAHCWNYVTRMNGSVLHCARTANDLVLARYAKRERSTGLVLDSSCWAGAEAGYTSAVPGP